MCIWVVCKDNLFFLVVIGILDYVFYWCKYDFICLNYFLVFGGILFWMKFKSVLIFLKMYLNYWYLIKFEWNGICIIGEKYVNGIIDMCKMLSFKECL